MDRYHFGLRFGVAGPFRDRDIGGQHTDGKFLATPFRLDSVAPCARVGRLLAALFLLHPARRTLLDEEVGARVAAGAEFGAGEVTAAQDRSARGAIRR